MADTPFKKQANLPYIPQEIKSLVENQSFMTDSIGKSDSTVLMFPDSVLKIQKTAPENRNEVEIISWLNGELPFPKIIKYIEENNTSYTLQSRINGKMLCDEEYLSEPEILINIVADVLKLLWSVDVTNCPVISV